MIKSVLFEGSELEDIRIESDGKNVLITSKVACYGFRLKKEEYHKSRLGELQSELNDIDDYRQAIESDLSDLDYCVNRARKLIKELEK
jgi:hypothetical protein